VLVGDLVGKTQHLRLMAPMRNMSIKELRKLRVCPCAGMNTVGDGTNGNIWKHLGSGFGMPLRHTIRVTAETECQAGHVKRAVSCQPLECLDFDEVAEQAVDEIISELVEGGGNWRVRGEHASAANRGLVTASWSSTPAGRVQQQLQR